MPVFSQWQSGFLLGYLSVSGILLRQSIFLAADVFLRRCQLPCRTVLYIGEVAVLDIANEVNHLHAFLTVVFRCLPTENRSPVFSDAFVVKNGCLMPSFSNTTADRVIFDPGFGASHAIHFILSLIFRLSFKAHYRDQAARHSI